MLNQWWAIPLGLIILLAALALIASLGPALLVRARERRDLHRRCLGRLVLTYDDGPGPALTGPLLDLLARFDARATFFLLGFRAADAPDVCDRLVETGHELGTHTDMHTHAWKVAPWTAVRDLHAGYERLHRWVRPDALFRPPFGKLTTWTLLAARRRRAPLSWWTVDAGDTWPDRPDHQLIVRRVLENGGAVVLMHSHHRGEPRQGYVLDLTERLLNAAREHQLEICTYSQLLQPPPTPPAREDSHGRSV
jgi:peptidoglycan/xylan/chitin deacetylase (PgdA/CDA1 family)